MHSPDRCSPAPVMIYDDDADLALLAGKPVPSSATAPGTRPTPSPTARASTSSSGCATRPTPPSRRATPASMSFPSSRRPPRRCRMIARPHELHRPASGGGCGDGVPTAPAALRATGFAIHYEEVDRAARVESPWLRPKGPGHLVRRLHRGHRAWPCWARSSRTPPVHARELALALLQGHRCTRGGVIETTFRTKPRPTCSASRRSCAAAPRAGPGLAFPTPVYAV